MWLPGDWKTFSPSPQDQMLFVGTIGMFLMLFLLFLRFLPCINIAEVKWAKEESDPHFEDNEAHPDEGSDSIAAYQKETVSSPHLRSTTPQSSILNHNSEYHPQTSLRLPGRVQKRIPALQGCGKGARRRLPEMGLLYALSGPRSRCRDGSEALDSSLVRVLRRHRPGRLPRSRWLTPRRS